MYTIIGGDQQQYGPITEEQLRQWIREGRANEETRTQKEGSDEWKPLAGFPEFSDLFPKQPPPPPEAKSGTPRLQSKYSIPTAHSVPSSTPPPSPPPPPPSTLGTYPKNNGFAVAGLICSVLGFLCCGPIGILGLIFSIIALNQINKNPELYTGKGLAIAGIVFAALSLISFLVLFATGSFEEIMRQLEQMR